MCLQLRVVEQPLTMGGNPHIVCMVNYMYIGSDLARSKPTDFEKKMHDYFRTFVINAPCSFFLNKYGHRERE